MSNSRIKSLQPKRNLAAAQRETLKHPRHYIYAIDLPFCFILTGKNAKIVTDLRCFVVSRQFASATQGKAEGKIRTSTCAKNVELTPFGGQNLLARMS
jgi:hypothetical protein